MPKTTVAPLTSPLEAKPRKRRFRLLALAPAIALALSLTPPVAAQAATSITLGPRSCTGSSYLYSTGVANFSTVHKLVLTNGNVAIRNFVNTTGAYRTDRYYTGLQGTVNRNGYSFVTLSGVWFGGANVSSASLSCDY